MNTEIPHLKIERLENGCIRLENESVGDSYVVDIHPLHLRYMAEKLGLARQMSASEAEALRMVDKLARRLQVLHERIEMVREWMWQNKDFEHCDITVEAWHMDATLDLSKEFVAEIEESRAAVTPRRSESRSTADAAPVPGAKPKANPTGTQRVPRGGPAPQLDLGVGHE
jgi:hypothetical protein